MTDLELPYIYAPIQCGHCFTNLETDGESYTCPSCGIYWDTGNPYDEEAHVGFLDEDAEACGEPPSSPAPREHGGYRFWDDPCTLPTGHESRHYHPLRHEPLEQATISP